MTPNILILLGVALGAALLIGLLSGGDDDDTSQDDDVTTLTDGDDDFDQRLAAPDAAALTVEAGGGDDIILTGDGADIITLGASNDPLLDGSVIGADLALAGLNDDVVYGGEGRDVILPEQGNDTAYGGAGDDVINDQSADRNTLGTFGDLEALRTVLVNDGFSENLLTFPELGDTHLRPDDDVFYGGAGNDDLTSGAGSDLLYGGTGDDRLVAVDNSGEVLADSLFGGLGADWLQGDDSDWLSGGTGADRFVIDHSTEAESTPGPLTIADYQVGVDQAVYHTSEVGTLTAIAGETGAVLRFLSDTETAATLAVFTGLSEEALSAEISAGRISIDTAGG